MQDQEAFRVLLAIDPLNYVVKEEFDLKILNENWISLMGIQIYVRGVINSTANPLDVINGYNLLMRQVNDEVNIDEHKLLRCICQSEQQDRKNSLFRVAELAVPKEVCLGQAMVNLLRLCYYYYKCSTVSSFQTKANEVKTKISGSLTIVELDSANFQKNMSILTGDIKDCASELMFAVLALDGKRNVQFDSKHDLTVDGIPCEVKTIHDRYYVSRGDNGKITFAAKKEGFGDISLLKELIAQVLRKKWKDHLKTAISHQIGKIILFNTYSTVLYDLNSMCNEGTISCLSFREILDSAISYTNSDNTIIPLICCTCIVSNPFDQSFFLAQIPIMSDSEDKIVLDEQRFNEPNLSENLYYQKKA